MDDAPLPTSARDQLLTDVIARHFDGAKIEGTRVVTSDGLVIRCHVNDVRDHGAYQSASLYFDISGGRFGDWPMFASISGYDATDESAIVTGGCHWACTLRGLLNAAFHDEPSDVTAFDTVVDGMPCRVFVDGIDRAFSRGNDQPPSTAQARTRLGGDPWLTPCVLAWEAMPPLAPERASLLSIFVGELPAAERIIEVKINGTDWPGLNGAIAEAPLSNNPGVLLRELAIVVPRGPAHALNSRTLARTLKHACTPIADNRKRSLAAWRGWDEHAGILGTPASEPDIAALEREVGPLPLDYRDFLLSVQHRGAGPGYGLVSPLHPAQRATALGEMSWCHDEQPSTPAAGMLLLAHAGCGNAWLLALNGAEPGTVWIDACGSEGRTRKVAGTFSEWYRRWIDALVRNAPTFVHWDGHACATPSVLSQLLDSLQTQGFSGDAGARELPNRIRANGIRCVCGGSEYFDRGDALDPCQSCWELARSFQLSGDVFAPGIAPKASRPVPPARTWFQRLFSQS